MAVDFKAMMQKAKEVQAEMEKAKEALSNEHIEGSSGGHAVTITMNGNYVVSKVKIDRNMLKDSVKKGEYLLIEELILSAMNDARKKVNVLSEETLVDITKRLKIPGKDNDRLPEED